MALAFAALPTAVDKLVLGMKTAEEVRLNVAAAAAVGEVPEAIWAEAQDAGLVSAGVQMPGR